MLAGSALGLPGPTETVIVAATRVSIIGQPDHTSRPELGRAMASLDLLVHPGADETFCQVIQEALCSGAPVVAAASGGPLDLVRHGENGWLWAGADEELLAAQVAAIRDDPAGLDRARRRTRPSVSGRTWTRVTDQLLGHYRRVIALRELSGLTAQTRQGPDRAALSGVAEPAQSGFPA